MDSFLTEELLQTANRLESDVCLVRKLLYRNRNQHGNTLAFSFARRVVRALSLQWKKDSLLLLQRASIEALRFHVGQTKLTLEVVQKIVLQGIAVAMTICSGTKAIHFATKGYHAYSELLRKQIFLPLFTVLWSLMAKIFKSVQCILLPLYETHLHISTVIQHIQLVNGKYSSVFTSQICDSLHISSQSFAVIETIFPSFATTATPHECPSKVDENDNMIKDCEEQCISLDVISGLLFHNDDSDMTRSRNNDKQQGSEEVMHDEISSDALMVASSSKVNSDIRKLKQSSGKKRLNDIGPKQATVGRSEESVVKRKKDDIDDIFGLL